MVMAPNLEKPELMYLCSFVSTGEGSGENICYESV